MSSPIPGMPNGRASGERCIQLDENNRCMIYNDPKRPKVCIEFEPNIEFCGTNSEEAFEILNKLVGID
jgi:Fe-S-cluster containining protein